jgi:hypothetical protein
MVNLLSLVANASAEPLCQAKLVGSRFPLKGNNQVERVILARSSIVVYDVQEKGLEGEALRAVCMQDFIQLRAEIGCFCSTFISG